MRTEEDQRFQEKVLDAARRMREQAQAGRPIHHVLDEITALALGGESGFTLSEDGRTLLLDGRAVMGVSQKGYALIEEHVRRDWAQKMRAEFEPYHEHSADGGECGACGAKQAADWMDPDYVKDGPTGG